MELFGSWGGGGECTDAPYAPPPPPPTAYGPDKSPQVSAKSMQIVGKKSATLIPAFFLGAWAGDWGGGRGGEREKDKCPRPITLKLFVVLE